MEFLFTLTENPIYKLELDSNPTPDKVIEIYKRAKNFNVESDYVNFCLNNIKNIDLILKFAPFEKIINLFINNKLISNYLTKDLIDDVINYHQTEFLLKKEKEKITLTNKFNNTYNFNLTVYKKRLNQILPEELKKCNIIFGETMIHDICNNQKFKEICENKQRVYWEIYFSKKDIISTYRKNESKNDFFLIKHENINFIIFPFLHDFNVVLNNNLFCGNENDIVASPLGYHSLANCSYISNQKIYDITEYTQYKKTNVGFQIKKNILSFDSKVNHHCYICKKNYNKKHIFSDYTFMCFECGMTNYLFEQEKIDMTNMTAFITGIRHTIGFSIALKLLRSGCFVIGTSRFPMCALHNYQQEQDYDIWKERLIICQCDFLNIESVQKTIELVKSYKPNIIINNACQTIRPTKEYYQRVSLIESSISEKMDSHKQSFSIKDTEKVCCEDKIINMNGNLFLNKKWSYTYNYPKVETGIIVPVNFTRNICDPNLDLTHNSWTLNLQSVTMPELLEVNAINQITPTIIIQQLLEHMQKPSFVIQVSAKEGIFNCNKSTEMGLHPHTNMCKAGMNMLIRTLGETKSDCNFYAVDPGYVSGTADKEYPLNINDGAQRVIYPVISYLRGNILKTGHYKNYKHHNW
jgi:NAD(P)-dependent dehydrogenase (short-subunit alcohol dehydrogenase family)